MQTPGSRSCNQVDPTFTTGWLPFRAIIQKALLIGFMLVLNSLAYAAGGGVVDSVGENAEKAVAKKLEKIAQIGDLNYLEDQYYKNEARKDVLSMHLCFTAGQLTKMIDDVLDSKDFSNVPEVSRKTISSGLESSVQALRNRCDSGVEDRKISDLYEDVKFQISL